MTTAPTILQVLPALNSGGVERGTVEMSQAIVDGGGSSLVISHGGQMVPQLLKTGATHVSMPVHSKNPLMMLWNAQRIAAHCRKHDVALIHARSRAPAWSAWLAAKQLKLPFVTTFHGVYNFEGRWKHKYNSIMTKGDRVIAVSSYVRDHILEHYDCPASRVTVIPRGADLSVFHPNNLDTEHMAELIADWHIEDRHEPIILMPGRFTRWKGQHVLVQALAQIKEERFTCILMGSDSGHTGYREEVEQMIHAAGLAEKIRYAPPTSYMTEAYRLSDIVVVPSIEPEAFGRVPVEAQAMGKLVIASNHGGMAETIRDGETGFHVPPNDPDALAAQILHALYMTKETRNAIGSQAMYHVHQNFSIRSMQNKTLDVYESLL